MPAYKRALVTGGAGFIGSHICQRLLENDIEVVAYDNLSMGRRGNVPAGAKLVVGDILDYPRLKSAARGIDIIFHNAAKVSIRHSVNDFINDANINIMGTANLIQAVIKEKVKKIVFASSMAVYGNAFRLPIDEAHPLNPESPYGIAKLASEKYCLSMGKFYGFEAVALRYFNTFGIRQTFTPYVGVITIFIRRLLKNQPPVIFGSGRQVRDFISVDDVARANILAMRKCPGGVVLNIGTGRGTSVNQIARLLIDRIRPGSKIIHGAIQLGEPASSIAGISKARRILGFKPEFRLEDKIDQIIAWNRRKNKD